MGLDLDHIVSVCILTSPASTSAALSSCTACVRHATRGVGRHCVLAGALIPVAISIKDWSC